MSTITVAQTIGKLLEILMVTGKHTQPLMSNLTGQIRLQPNLASSVLDNARINKYCACLKFFDFHETSWKSTNAGRQFITQPRTKRPSGIACEQYRL